MARDLTSMAPPPGGNSSSTRGSMPQAGWMHTSSGVDNVDEFAESVETRGAKRQYRYGQLWRDLTTRAVTIRYRTADGRMAERRFTTYRSHHGPIIRTEGDKWIAFSMMHRPVQALQQSYLRTKATDLGTFLDVTRLRANSSNNTIFADSRGRDCLSPRPIRAGAKRGIRLYQARRWKRSPHRLGIAPRHWRIAERHQFADRLGHEHQ